MTETFLKEHPGQVTTACTVYDEKTNKTIVFLNIENSSINKRPFIRKIVPPKWDMRHIKPSPQRELRLTDIEHLKFSQALKTQEGRKAVAELKNKVANIGLNNFIDFLSDKLIKVDNLKKVFLSLKNHDLQGNDNQPLRSLSISVRDMYDYLIEKKIIKL
jgi:hypothetical protein